jgi:sterol desaturase/sphingolipid hydroxylase (fatty acid hydroxylase superfamily)
MNEQIAASNALYESVLKPRTSRVVRAILGIWTVGGLFALIFISWTAPYSRRLFGLLVSRGTVQPWFITFVLNPLVMFICGCLIVETIGYAYHRYMQHVTFFARSGQVIRRNNRFHWIHHMIVYPFGNTFKRDSDYVSPGEGSFSTWTVPAIVVCSLFLLTHHPLTLAYIPGNIAFLGGILFQSKFMIELSHHRFHQIHHPWVNNRLFKIAEEIHILHHYDQRTNFGIAVPFMDFLFGTYMSPAKHKAEIRALMNDEELSRSDLTNWNYLLSEATPGERAAFICAAEKHPRSVKKVRKVVQVMRDRLTIHPEDTLAKDLELKALDVLVALNQPSPQAVGMISANA